MSNLLTMNQKELTRVEVMQQLKIKRPTQAKAATQLQISVRQPNDKSLADTSGAYDWAAETIQYP